MDVFKLAGLSAVTALLSLTLKSIRQDLGFQVALGGGLIILVLSVTELSGIVNKLRALTVFAGMDTDVFDMMLKVTGIAYITDISAGICRDAGENTLALKTELCGRLMIISAAIPGFIELAGNLIKLADEVL